MCYSLLRVAAYCRVSTGSEDQLESYKAQVAYYTDAIAKNPRWRFVDIYADKGITGVMAKKRTNFMRMMRDCEKGKNRPYPYKVGCSFCEKYR